MSTPVRIYKDFDLLFGRSTPWDPSNPQAADALTTTGDIPKRLDVNAVKQSIKNLLFVRKGERLFHPEIGTELYKILFEPLDIFTTEILKDIIIETIRKYEPRVNLQLVEINPNYDENAYEISLYFYVVGIYTPVTFNLTLQRLR